MPDRISKATLFFVIAVVGTGVWSLAEPNWWSCGFYMLAAGTLIAIAFSGGAPESPPGDHAVLPVPHAEPAPVFEESREFARLDVVEGTVERKRIAQRIERKIKNGAMLSKQQALDAAGSPWELDRIGLYLWETSLGLWPEDEPEVHVRHEFDLLLRVKASKVTSRMPLYYAVESWEVCLRQRKIDPGPPAEELLAEVEEFLPPDDRKIRRRIQSIRQWIEQVRMPQPGAEADAPVAQYDPGERDRLYAELVEKAPIKLRLTSLHLFMTVNDSGDAVLRDRYDQLYATGDAPVSSLPTVLEPEFGFVPHAPRYNEYQPDTQTVQWRFLEPQDGKFPSEVIFDPPVAETPISFTRTWTSFNGIYFNQRDLSDAMVQPSDRETFSHLVRHAYDQLTLRVQLPEGHFPKRADVRVQASCGERTAGGERKNVLDQVETAWIDHNVSVWEDDCVLQLVIPQPLPGYVYAITWSLPPTDADEQLISKEAQNVGSEMIQRLNSVATDNSPYRLPAIEALNQLAQSVEKDFGNDLRVRLFAYRRMGGKGGLVEVLDRAGSPPNLELITIGRNLVGQAFRRKETVTYQSIRPPVDPPNQYEPIPSEAGLPLPAGAIAVGLTCPVQRGRRIGVVYIASRSPDTKLVAVARNEGDAVKTLDKMVAIWYANRLASALRAKEMLQKVSMAAAKEGAKLEVDQSDGLR